MKLFKNKKAMWRAISFNIEDTLGLPKMPEQCENRFKTVKKRKCHQRAHNRSFGVEPVQEEYSEEFRKIEAADDSLKPDLLRGPGRVEFKAATASAVDKAVAPRKRAPNAIAEMMWKIHEDREQQSERRHKEKMDLFRSFLAAEKNDA